MLLIYHNLDLYGKRRIFFSLIGDPILGLFPFSPDTLAIIVHFDLFSQKLRVRILVFHVRDALSAFILFEPVLSLLSIFYIV